MLPIDKGHPKIGRTQAGPDSGRSMALTYVRAYLSYLNLSTDEISANRAGVTIIFTAGNESPLLARFLGDA